jgi:hypothetical protein
MHSTYTVIQVTSVSCIILSRLKTALIRNHTGKTYANIIGYNSLFCYKIRKIQKEKNIYTRRQFYFCKKNEGGRQCVLMFMKHTSIYHFQSLRTLNFTQGNQHI